MKYICAMLVVDDIETSKAFYHDVLGQTIKYDFGENVTFHGDFAIHKKSHYQGLIGNRDIRQGEHAVELYFEYNDVEKMERDLAARGVEFVHRTSEQPWRQKVLRCCDPDGYIIEIGESLAHLSHRLHGEGVAEERIAEIVGIPVGMVREGMDSFGKGGN
ncbi:MAG TPA: VOC family protein [Spirochaetota bacterium]|nr:VOC family protein [Spirochaetota bacterium]